MPIDLLHKPRERAEYLRNCSKNNENPESLEAIADLMDKMASALENYEWAAGVLVNVAASNRRLKNEIYAEDSPGDLECQIPAQVR